LTKICRGSAFGADSHPPARNRANTDAHCDVDRLFDEISDAAFKVARDVDPRIAQQKFREMFGRTGPPR
jgi:hypothetical protein